MNLKKTGLILIALTVTSLILAGCGSKTADNRSEKNAYPKKTIKIVNILAPGTGPDVMARKVAGIMEKKSGWSFEFENLPQNSGVDAVNKVWNAPHDGYTVLAQTENILGMSVRGLIKQTAKDWDFYEMLQEPSAFVVAEDSPYKSIKDLVDAAKANPNQVKVGARKGSSFDLKVKVLDTVTGAQFTHIDYMPKDDIMGILASKGVDAVLVPYTTSKDGIAQGKFRVLAVADANSYDYGGKVGVVDSVIKTYPEYKKYLPLDAVPGLALPADVPKEVKDEFGRAFENAMDDPEMAEYIAQVGSIKVNLWGESAKPYMSKMESNIAWVAKDMGLATVDPETLGIPRP